MNTETTTIYRIEDTRGLGPYNGDAAECGIMDALDPGRHPEAYEDGILEWYGQHRFGFATLDQLFDWFSDWLVDLADIGYYITVYIVPIASICYGGKQLAFIHTEATQEYQVRTDQILDLVA